jgi:hypothetical protein
MQERETKTITTPDGKAVVVNTYLTGRESNQLKEILYAGLKMGMSDISAGITEIKDIPASLLLDQEKKALEMLVVSIDGATDGVVEKLLDMKDTEYQFIVSEINNVTKGNFPKEK